MSRIKATSFAVNLNYPNGYDPDTSGFGEGVVSNDFQANGYRVVGVKVDSRILGAPVGTAGRLEGLMWS